ncbi:AraC-type DNA-binding protein [Chitinophaga sp. CF118]|uniref:helix-turn-helix domain-containing protein n=1 Tax=Chitinophaga sp. CF118 TaxID=1884367 RepID=UPI0008E6B884|nr:helix-turn-helix domain-containing protein [Chitinophaga sp. CF118]SFD13817.1 AraC-type DNA-binding protein [Chitinophaga sp. CF118]
MRRKENVTDFLERSGRNYSEAGRFNVYKVDEFYKGNSSPLIRRDYYKISLICKGEGLLSYADKSFHIKDNAIIFGNPMIPYSWERISEKQTGYFCMFTEEFIHHQLKSKKLSESPLFKVNGNPVLFPSQKSMDLMVGIFEQMLVEITAAYTNKYELLLNYVQIIIHEALKMSTPENINATSSSSIRITELFLELLERQFPISSPQHILQLKNPGEFAKQLSIHPNHLNKSLKEVTGKTTSIHISERIINESKDLLINSNWDIAEIGYCLGFEHASNFNIFFRKHTGQTPNHFRRQMIDGNNN